MIKKIRFINLDLPSKNLWSSRNLHGYYTEKDANKYSNCIPRREDFEELLKYTIIKRDRTNSSLTLFSKKNKNKNIKLEALGYKEAANTKVFSKGSYLNYWIKEKGFVTSLFLDYLGSAYDSLRYISDDKIKFAAVILIKRYDKEN